MKTEQMLVKQITKARFSGVKIPVQPDDYPQMAKTYTEALVKYSSMEIKNTIDRLLQTMIIFPSVAEIIENIKGSRARIGADDYSRQALPAGKGMTFIEFIRKNPDKYYKFVSTDEVRNMRRATLLKRRKDLQDASFRYEKRISTCVDEEMAVSFINALGGLSNKLEDIQFELDLLAEIDNAGLQKYII